MGEVRQGVGGGSLWTARSKAEPLLGEQGGGGLRVDVPENKRFDGLNRAFSCEIYLPQSLTLLPCKMKEGCMYMYIIFYAFK